MKHVSNCARVGLLLVGTGCSVGTFTGSVAGSSLTPKDAVSASAHFAAQSSSGVELQALTMGVVALRSTADACSDVGSNIARENERAVLFYLLSVGDSAAQPSEGDYLQDSSGYNAAVTAKSTGKFAVGEFKVIDGSCRDATSLSGQGGTMTAGKVTVDSADGNGIHGAFDATFGDSDRVKGTFSTSSCAPLEVSLRELAFSLGYNVGDDNLTITDPNDVHCKP